jgi:hypothetical protein
MQFQGEPAVWLTMRGKIRTYPRTIIFMSQLQQQTQSGRLKMKRRFVYSILLALLISRPSFPQSLSWQPTNGPPGGLIYDTYVHDSQIMLTSAARDGFLYRSTNGGTTWAQVGSSPAYIAPFVRHRSGFIIGSAGNLVMKSADAGLTWIPQGIVGGYITAFCVDSAGIVFAGTQSGTGLGVYRSTDGGLTWTQTSLTPASTINRLAVTSTGAILAATYQGIYRSTDGGTTWQQSNTGLSSMQVSSMTVTPNLVFIGTIGGGVFRSDDFGKTWNRFSIGLTNFNTYDIVVSTFGQLYVATASSVFRSVDNGLNWSMQANVGLPFSSIRLISQSNGTLFAWGSDYGLLRSTDQGNSWSASHAGIQTNIFPVLVSNASDHVFAAYVGIYRTTDQGTTWTQVAPQTLTVGSMAAGSGSTMYAGTSSGVYRSTDNGSSWQATTMTSYSIVAAGQGTTVYAGNTLAMFRSTNSGVTWDSVNTGLPRGSFRAVAVSPTGTVYASIAGKGLFRSTNNGASWSLTSLSAEAYNLLCPSDQVVLAASDASAGGVYRSSDNGNNWQKMSNGIPTSWATSLAVGTGGTLYAGFDGTGVYASTNNGSSWFSANQGLTKRAVQSLARLSSGTLMAGVNGGPVFAGVPVITPPAPTSWFSVRSLVFSGSVRIGQFKDSILYIGNTGTDTLKVSSIVSSNPAFTPRLTNAKIAPSYAIVDTIRFAPTSAGLISGVILVTSNAATSPDTIKVSGVGGGQSAMTLGATNILFGSTAVGKYKDAQLLISNIGNDTLKIQSITSSNAAFTARPASKTLPPGLSFVDTIRFTPSLVGAESGTLLIISNALTSPDSVTVSGAGSGVASMASSVSIVSFGSVPIGQYKDTLVTFTNAGNDTLKIVSITSTNASFTARPSSKVVPPGLLFVDTVRFAPTTVGTLAGSLLVISNAVTSPDTVKVSGEGLPAVTGIAEAGIPLSFGLGQNFPNPFNPSTTISYSLPKAAFVTLRVFNTLGQEVALLTSGPKEPGHYQTKWNASDVPSGVYFYRLHAGEFVATQRMILLK